MKGKQIGSGSFGTVHLAMNKSTGSLFVVKSAVSDAGVEALQNEASILESLDSPYIVQCLGRDFLKERNGRQTLDIFMEYMTEGSLSDVAEKFGGTLDSEVVRLYTREILHGLKFLHGNGIVHCDLKCKNVLLKSNGNVKLADFGCARNGDLTTFSWQSVGGTPLWMAPEVLRNEGLDFASDIWSLGCLVIEMATGRLPWGDKISNLLTAVLKIACSSEKPQFPADFPEAGLDFLEKCLERNPKERWTAEELLNHPFISQNFVKNPSEKCVCSPSSVLDVGTIEEDYDSDESDSTKNHELHHKNPFSTRLCGRKTRMVTLQEPETEFWSSEDWITVR
ncbi:hypothetical protein Patl1_14284 [Pistacia atlantica]|uniref:Uncharacterized protein n=1 Tax=Pistacia atlantica TaxID=434234 RepID=A0ACC1AWS9_9ROSI|nr:hypothetical protein Patl1_14284 [Pistacia atlantica]